MSVGKSLPISSGSTPIIAGRVSSYHLSSEAILF